VDGAGNKLFARSRFASYEDRRITWRNFRNAREYSLQSWRDDTELRRLRFLLAFLKNDQRAMQEQLDWAAARPDAAPVLLYERSGVEAYYGHFREARIMTEQAVAHGFSSSWNAGAGVGKIVPALREVEVGNIIPARREATDAVRKGLDPDGQLAMALVFART
jgi:hypothetical protein